jgi:hypothetical protein
METQYISMVQPSNLLQHTCCELPQSINQPQQHTMSELKHLPMTPKALGAEREALLEAARAKKACQGELSAAKAAKTPKAFFNAVWRNAGWLFRKGLYDVREVPENLECKVLDLGGCTSLTRLPEQLECRVLYLCGCTNLTQLPEQLECEWLNLSGCTGLTRLPEQLECRVLELYGCTGLTRLPESLNCKELYLNGCTGLTRLPEGLKCEWLNVSGCTGLTQLPEQLKCEVLYLGGCPAPVPETAQVGEVIR